MSLFVLPILFDQHAWASPIDKRPITQDSSPANRSQTKFVGYVQDPDGRGTASLFLSCVLTLILCVWSALHLNVPPPGEHRASCFFRNLRWIITGVFAPELVVFAAWRQWSSARLLGGIIAETKLENRQNDKSAQPGHKTAVAANLKEIPDDQNQLRWTRVHDFFASTGGFAFEVESPEQFLPDTCPKRLTVTARGMALLARCGYLPDIPVEDILDKSKANDLAKALVVVQAGWMLIQTVGRLIARLPVTLLEVNTVAHVYVEFPTPIFSDCILTAL